MNINEIKNELLLQRALLHFQIIDDSELEIKAANKLKIQECFNLLADTGIYFEEFLDILHPAYSLDRFLIQDFTHVFDRALKKLDIYIPTSNDEAMYNIIGYYLLNMLNDDYNPLKRLVQFIDAMHLDKFDLSFRFHESYGYGIEEIIYLFVRIQDELNIYKSEEINWQKIDWQKYEQDYNNEIELAALKWINEYKTKLKLKIKYGLLSR